MYRNYFLGLFILQIFEICHNFTKLRSFLSKFELYVGKFPIISFWGIIADKLLLLSKKNLNVLILIVFGIFFLFHH